ncbi:MAG TPA: c-type cytochrome, partial [Candidatus Acidoferrales bacterium]|nr:c-type cytochrome [Candidatus Acidoferrales bacterium]
MISATLVLALNIPMASAQRERNTSGKKDVYAELAKAPRKAVARRNPLEGDPDAVAAGEKLFGLHCAECHGEMAEGGRKAPSLLADPVQQAAPG